MFLRRLGEKIGYLIMAAFAGTNLHLVLPSSAVAQTDNDTGSDDQELEEIVVTAVRRQGYYRNDELSLSKMTELLRDTPQSITTMSRDLMDDRGVTSLSDALRTVPGITLGAGEFSWQGNSPSIRGFSSRSDMFLDGMRDFGSYSRDPFNLEAIEVLEGPSSMIFGRGSTGGVINQVSKVPTTESLTTVSVNIGNDSTRRGTADIVRPLRLLGDAAAFRLNAMAHQSEVADRDVGQSRRYGVAPSLAVGLGRSTRVTLSYLHQSADNTPDYGLPWFAGRPAPVPRNNFYGFQSDYLKTDADILTTSFEHDFGAALSVNARVRYANYERDSRLTEPLIASAIPPTTPPADITVNRNVFIGNSEETMLLTQADLVGRFDTGPLEHTLVTGVELGRETSAPSFGFGVGVPGTNLLIPNINDQFSATSTEPRLQADTEGKTLAVYALDTMKLGEAWRVIAGLRLDRFDADYQATRFSVDGEPTGTEAIQSRDKEPSYRAAVVYKPALIGSIYLGWGTSFNPSAEDISFITSGRGLAIGNMSLAPEENETLEVGTKWELLDEALSLSAAVFRITKSNARVPDPANPGFNILAGTQRVDGVAFNVTGNVTNRWQITAGYTFLDSEIIESAPGAAPVGSPLRNAPEHSLSLWATYQLSERMQLGAGSRYISERLAQNVPPVKQVPDYWTFDAMGTYQISDKVTVKLNLTNLTSEYYFDQLHPWHVIPGGGFTAVFAINLDL